MYVVPYSIVPKVTARASQAIVATLLVYDLVYHIPQQMRPPIHK